MNVLFSNRALFSSVFPPFVVGTAWVTLLYAVGLAECRAATSIGRIGLESIALGKMAEFKEAWTVIDMKGDWKTVFPAK
jgi:hypothetical protein